MAIIKKFGEEEDKKITTSSESQSFSGTPAGANGIEGATTAPADNTPNTGWTNLDTFLKLNAGQSSGTADQLAKDINGKVDAFKNKDTSSIVNDINKQDGKDQVAAINNSLNSNISDAAAKAKGLLGRELSLKAKEDYTKDFKTEKAELDKGADALMDRESQAAQLKKLNNKPGQNYTSGFGALDSFLLFGDKESRGKLDSAKTLNKATAADKFGKVESDVSKAITDTTTNFGLNKEAARKSVRDKYDAVLGGAAGRVQSVKDQQKQAAMDALNNTFNANKDDFTADLASKTGDYLKTNNDFGTSDVVNDAELDALNTLAGVDTSIGRGPFSKTNRSAFGADTDALAAFLGSEKGSRQKVREEIAAKKAEEERVAAVEAQAKAQKAEEARLAREEQDRKNEGAKKLMEKNNAVLNKVVTVGNDINAGAKTLFNLPGQAVEAIRQPVERAVNKQVNNVKQAFKKKRW